MPDSYKPHRSIRELKRDFSKFPFDAEAAKNLIGMGLTVKYCYMNASGYSKFDDANKPYIKVDIYGSALERDITILHELIHLHLSKCCRKYIHLSKKPFYFRYEDTIDELATEIFHKHPDIIKYVKRFSNIEIGEVKEEFMGRKDITGWRKHRMFG